MQFVDMQRDINFFSGEMLCTRTLYNYVDLGILKIKSIDLPPEIKKKTSIKKNYKK